MITSPELAQAPLLLAELPYCDIPRDTWARTLLRARQLGANTIVTPIHWRWHAPAPDLIDLSGTSDPQRDLIGFVTLCNRLNLSVILNFGAVVGENVFHTDVPAWLGMAPFSEHTLQSKLAAQLATEHLAAARRWVGACSSALLPHQSPHGPIAALHLAGDSQLRSWLQDEGWSVPIRVGPPSHISAAGYPTALENNLAYGATLLATGQPTLPSGNRSAPPMLRSDGSARPNFWRIKSMHMLFGAAGRDFAAARAPSDLALLADAHVQPLAQRLANAGITFDRLDPAQATPTQLAQYALVIAAGALAKQPGVRATLGECTNLASIGGRPGAPPSALQLADDISADAVGELIEARGGNARYAWADCAAIDVNVRYGSEYIYLFVHNRQAGAYNGMLAYRAPGGDVLHAHVGIGAGRAGIIMLREDEVVGAAIDGDGAEGGWLARGLTSSMVFNAGAGGIVPCGHGLLLMAPQSGRFQIRRSAGWAEMQAHRLLMSGELIPARVQIDAAHVLLPYTAEDDCGQTDMYLVLPREDPLPTALRAYLAAPLLARALDLEAAAEIAEQIAPEAAPKLHDAAHALGASAARLITIADYTVTWHDAETALHPLIGTLEQALEQARTSGIERLSISHQPPSSEEQIARLARFVADIGSV
jgi:Glycosyl hydrolases family 35